VPRSLFVDFDPIVIDSVRKGPYRRLYSPNSLLCSKGDGDGANNYARSYYGLGKNLIEPIMEELRK